MTLGLRSPSGYFRRTSVVALAVFTHHWYWFALSYFLSLALKPTVLIGLTPRMVLPKMQVPTPPRTRLAPFCLCIPASACDCACLAACTLHR